MKKIEEFWYCVASQEQLPLFKGNEISAGTSDDLIRVIQAYKKKQGEPEQIIAEMILDKPEDISTLRILVGVSDKRLYLDLTFLVHIFESSSGLRLVNESRQNLLKHDTQFFVRLLKDLKSKKAVADLIAHYFVERGIIEFITACSSMTTSQMTQIFNNLIAPKEIQQMQAKYRGHGAEQAFARCFTFFGLNIVPVGKDIDPMAAHDPNVDLATMTVVPRDTSNSYCHSFDLLVKDSNGNIRILVQSLIHSSDPGQYGVNKSDETILIKQQIDEFNSKVTHDKKVFLWGSVDGVGFCENPRGTIEKMLPAFDEFFQMNTLFKIPCFLQKLGLANNIRGIALDKEYFSPLMAQYFSSQYFTPANVVDANKIILSECKTVQMGKAKVFYQ